MHPAERLWEDDKGEQERQNPSRAPHHLGGGGVEVVYDREDCTHSEVLESKEGHEESGVLAAEGRQVPKTLGHLPSLQKK
eukprot:CAMPEP_0182858638 /NCGR_PEP_ID=MMETSP0034_2-20130328/3797_1 /TAXON_ID=156128 /ORGANISM="Nephroselmis pyriformis, Strain CCMP717" /LENGTH=79 /DNA_ID=CAMNT_0024990087 /DNA_START=381 /DNA_END=620 /DNA_ORIENTATION=-